MFRDSENGIRRNGTFIAENGITFDYAEQFDDFHIWTLRLPRISTDLCHVAARPLTFDHRTCDILPDIDSQNFARDLFHRFMSNADVFSNCLMKTNQNFFNLFIVYVSDALSKCSPFISYDELLLI